VSQVTLAVVEFSISELKLDSLMICHVELVTLLVKIGGIQSNGVGVDMLGLDNENYMGARRQELFIIYELGLSLYDSREEVAQDLILYWNIKKRSLENLDSWASGSGLIARTWNEVGGGFIPFLYQELHHGH
ncbi:hypothetical protein ACJX0J_019420, partial [Zea mays]